MSMPIMTTPTSASSINSTMLVVMQNVMKEGGALHSQESAMDILASACSDEVARLIPSSWDELALAFTKLFEWESKSAAFEAVIEDYFCLLFVSLFCFVP